MSMRNADPLSSLPGTGQKGIAYVMKRFPRLSETFILNEIIGLEEKGLPLRIVSIHPADTAVLHKHAKTIKAPIFYIPESVIRELPILLRAQFHFLFFEPGRWIRAFNVMFWRHSLKAVQHWLKAGLVARKLEGTEVRHFHAHFSTSPTAVAMMASVLLGMRYSLSCHAKDVYAAGRLRSPGFHRNLIRASFVVVVSQRTKQDILGAWTDIPPSKIHVIYNGLDLSRFRFREDDGKGRVVLSVGRLVEKKGFRYLVEALARVKETGVRFKGEIVGYGTLGRALSEQISSCGLSGEVRMLGPMAQDELVSHYRNASVFCLATLVADNDDRDILPNVLKEAMAVGLPVLSTKIPAMDELVEDNRTGMLVDPKDTEALADGLRRLLEDNKLRERLAAAARREIEERFDRSKNTLQLFQLLIQQLA